MGKKVTVGLLKALLVMVGFPLSLGLVLPAMAGQIGSVGSLQEAAGEYQGEVRLQSSDGKIDRLLLPHARLTIDVSGDELVIRNSSDLMGRHCRSKIGSVRELLKFSATQPQVLRAVFDFDSNLCHPKNKRDSLVIFLIRDQGNELTLETLPSQGPIDLEGNSTLIQNLNVHGFFTKKEPQLSASRN